MCANLEHLTDDLEEPYALIGHVRFGEGHRALLITEMEDLLCLLTKRI